MDREEYQPKKSWVPTCIIVAACVFGVMVIVIAVLAALLMPALGKAREMARKVKCSSNLRQVGLALMQYVDEHGARRYYPCPKGRPGVPDDYTGKHFLATIWWTNVISEPGIFICPSTTDDNSHGYDLGPRDGEYSTETVGGLILGDDAPTGVPAPRWLADDTTAHNYISYASKGWKVSYPPGKTIQSVLEENIPSDTVIACDDTTNPANHSDGFNALFADTHVEFISGQQYGTDETDGTVGQGGAPPLDMVCN